MGHEDHDHRTARAQQVLTCADEEQASSNDRQHSLGPIGLEEGEHQRQEVTLAQPFEVTDRYIEI